VGKKLYRYSPMMTVPLLVFVLTLIVICLWLIPTMENTTKMNSYEERLMREIRDAEKWIVSASLEEIQGPTGHYGLLHWHAMVLKEKDKLGISPPITLKGTLPGTSVKLKLKARKTFGGVLVK
jgi:hypothetical protein